MGAEVGDVEAAVAVAVGGIDVDGFQMESGEYIAVGFDSLARGVRFATKPCGVNVLQGGFCIFGIVARQWGRYTKGAYTCAPS